MRNHIFQLYVWRRGKHSIVPLPAKEPLLSVLLCVCRLSVYLMLFVFSSCSFPVELAGVRIELQYVPLARVRAVSF